MGSCCSNVENDFVAPDAEKLANLGPGCFVRIEYQTSCVWVEITRVDGKQFRGILHPELSKEQRTSLLQKQGAEVSLAAEQINALGCDRYCYCD